MVTGRPKVNRSCRQQRRRADLDSADRDEFAAVGNERAW
jgi:hypothetical protein